ncbi:21584_t:CDS:2, partial [Racocetra persica]
FLSRKCINEFEKARLYQAGSTNLEVIKYYEILLEVTDFGDSYTTQPISNQLQEFLSENKNT